jgi:hypothetical protein
MEFDRVWLAPARAIPLSSKRRLLQVSLVLASSICLTALALTALEAASVVAIAHPLFWFPMAIGSFGVAGSNFIHLHRLRRVGQLPTRPQIFVVGSALESATTRALNRY